MPPRSFFLGLLLLALGSSALAGDQTNTVALADVPAAVRKTIAAQIADGRVDSIQPGVDAGYTNYVVNYTAKPGTEHDFKVDDDGTLLSVGMEVEETPAAVQKTIHTVAQDWDITGIDKNVVATTSYDVTIAKAGHEKGFNVDNNGVLASRDLGPEEIPAVVQACITAQAAGATNVTVTENFVPNGNNFDVTAILKDGAQKGFSVGQNGRLLSQDVTLDQVPAAARQTIQATIGNGKILNIDRSTEQQDGVLPYEIQGRKDGHPFNFIVSPLGRFLGMDE